MAGKLYMADKTFPFDEDIFFADYQDEPDLVKNVLVTSGIMVDDPLIKSKVNAGNQFTIPFYNALDEADEQNYDGVTDITLSSIGAQLADRIHLRPRPRLVRRRLPAGLHHCQPHGRHSRRAAKWTQTKRNKRLAGIAEAGPLAPRT